ncbi:polyprenyl synthetase family protein [Panacibacter ginsenosidivorans]|uniref:Polyprenyl synthetase family protein n=1 Tax=Panacibacter ginsenosidivorans TaxID=1813871 RepID=A0A5B8V8V2_9BACT|nr:polyprenyl synthetase family protein [Panacibacter ginsenosidivorans]QEC67343.1 polyprenyl synthetase family protein [Panacibacter ginsenosidivorans]
MHSFEQLADLFKKRFETKHFPATPQSLYESCDYFLSIGGKRVRPVMCLMGNELFDEINPDAWYVATAIELFHNFTLMHDDIMDAAPLRRGMQTVHTKFGNNTALLGGDVMLVVAYDYLNKINNTYLHKVIALFNKTAREVCEGQQLDMDYEKQQSISLDDYIRMIELKTSVLLAASLQLGAILGGASEGNRQHIYEFGRNLGIAFQIQDDYLDAFGDPQKFGKDVGGDIRQNKKTFLLIHVLEAANSAQKKTLLQLMEENPADKVQRVLEIFKACNVDEWAWQLKQQYMDKAMQHLDAVAVVSSRKKSLMELANFLVQREH